MSNQSIESAPTLGGAMTDNTPPPVPTTPPGESVAPIAAEDQKTPRQGGWAQLPGGAKVAIVIGGLVVLLGIIAAIVIAVVATQAAATNPFEEALESCEINEGGDARLLDDGESLLIDMEGEESGGLAYASTLCVIVMLEVPDATISRMESTRAMDGRQEDEWDGMSVEWTYHPDDGLDLLFTRQND